MEPAHEVLYLNHVYDIMCDLTFEDDEKVTWWDVCKFMEGADTDKSHTLSRHEFRKVLR